MGETLESDNRRRDFFGCFHFSIAWTLEKPLVDDPAVLDTQNESKSTLDKVKALQVHFNNVKVKLGNVVESIDLDDAPRTVRGAIT